MNFLAHVYLAGPGWADRLGAMLGDFVKGPLASSQGVLPQPVIDGIALHRHIDSYLDASPAFSRSRARMSPQFRRVAGIAIDVFYDHFLAANWSGFSDEPLESYARDVYDLLDEHAALLPPRLERLRHAMRADDWLTSYRDRETPAFVLDRMARRLSRPELLDGAGAELIGHYGGLEKDFFDAMAELAVEIPVWRARRASGTPTVGS
ncbi:ACP phosphodiesterase [Uliginosibacterium sp. sgz301328]|uniref:acyl carrier protein phosphodiesterase n=1 Tax=Uliginosibacterium sp. sgz301328 TaxID=3243764 RepID=UPI00359CDCED